MNPLVLISVFVLAFGAAAPSAQPGKVAEIDSFNIPAELRTCVKAEPELELDGQLNPFYISGDYDGDGLTDFAAQVHSRKSDLHGLLFCFATGRRIVIGAGAPVLWQPRSGGPDRDWPFDSWRLVRKGSSELSAHTKAKYDALALILSEINDGLLYWDGNRFLWWQQPEE